MVGGHGQLIPACVAEARQQGSLCDLVIRSMGAEGWESHPCHVSVLAAVSPVLRSVLGELVEERNPVIISEVGGGELVSLLYKGELVCQGRETAREMWDILADLGVEGEISVRKVRTEKEETPEIQAKNSNVQSNLRLKVKESKTVMHILLGVGPQPQHPPGAGHDVTEYSSALNCGSAHIPTPFSGGLSKSFPGVNKTSGFSEAKRKSDLLFHCPECKDRFSTDLNLKTHIADNHTVLSCPHCVYQVKGNNSLVQHLIQCHQLVSPPEVTSSTPSCRICGETLVTNQALKFHLYKHTGVKPYNCDVCGAKFRTPSTLKSHVEVQHTETKNKCDICGLKSSTSGKLKIHMRTHTNEKPYQCAFCPNSFKQLSVLKVHEFVHTKKSNYRCERCGAFFPTRCRLASHRSRPVCVSRGPRGEEVVSLQAAAPPMLTEDGGGLDTQLLQYQADSLEIPGLVDISVKGDELAKHSDIMFSL
jgi:hypothetical protein